MSRYITALFITVLAFTASGRAQDGKRAPLQTVPSVDLQKYKGKWYEIARYPNRFQRKCVGNTTATYELEDDGDINVINECVEMDGEIDRAKGEAKIVDNSSNAKLKVRFAPGFLSFLPFVWGDYWIIDLADDYSYAAVGDPKRKYFWILSRTPELDTATYQAILRRAEEKGFDPLKVIETPQNVDVIKGQVVVGEETSK